MAGANWNNPSLTTAYSDFLADLKARDVDAVTLFYNGDPTNPVTGMMKYDRSTNVLKEWGGAAWNTKLLAVAGGGTGANDASGARTNLGLGTMATQNASAVTITGGSHQGINADLTFSANNTYNLGANSTRVKNVYVGNGMVIPVGTDKYITG